MRGRTCGSAHQCYKPASEVSLVRQVYGVSWGAIGQPKTHVSGARPGKPTTKCQHFKYGRLWADDKIVVPKNRIQEVITAHHDPIVACHWVVRRTLNMIQRWLYFQRMIKLVADHISSCDVCQHAKADHHRPQGRMERVSLPVQKWQATRMDWIVALPRITRDGRVYDSVLTVMERATKMTHFI